MGVYGQFLNRVVRSCLKVTKTGVHCGCLVYCVLEYVGDFVICSGPSMEPTIYSSDMLITEHISILRNKVSKGDIVISRCPSKPSQYICKRVAGVPGDKIGIGFLNRYVPKGHVWLEGDNKNNSTDSRSYGPVPIGLLRGKVVCKVLPLKDATIF